MICIWCKRDGVPISVEHIIPESLGCPEGFVLSKGEVCQKCNNKLGNVDQAILHEFEVMSFWNGIPRKKGKPPKIDSFPGLRGEMVNGEKTFYLNMEKYAVVPHIGLQVPPRNANVRALEGSIEQIGDMAKIEFSFQIGKHKKFNRALHKVAFTSAAYFLGVPPVSGNEYDHIRQYVLHGGEPRPVIMLRPEQHKYRHEVFAPLESETTGYYLVRMVLCGLTFLVDLSPDMEALFEVKSTLEHDQQYKGWWSMIPPNRAT